MQDGILGSDVAKNAMNIPVVNDSVDRATGITVRQTLLLQLLKWNEKTKLM